MSEFFPKELREELAQAQKRARQKSNRLRVKVGEEYYPVSKFTSNGFSLERDSAPRLRGLVDIYDGGTHLYQCLIVASSLDDDMLRYEFKRNTQAVDKAPLDHYRDPEAPIALLGR